MRVSVWPLYFYNEVQNTSAVGSLSVSIVGISIRKISVAIDVSVNYIALACSYRSISITSIRICSSCIPGTGNIVIAETSCSSTGMC